MKEGDLLNPKKKICKDCEEERPETCDCTECEGFGFIQGPAGSVLDCPVCKPNTKEKENEN